MHLVSLVVLFKFKADGFVASVYIVEFLLLAISLDVELFFK